MIYKECRHIKSSGCKCQAPALRGMPYCYFHMRLHRALHARRTGPPAATVPATDDAINLPAVEDRSAIQLALTQVIQDLGAKRIDPHRAGQLLYGLQIASQLAERSAFVSTSRYVQTVSTGNDGEDIAPDQLVCEEGDDCNKCPYKEACGGPEDEKGKQANDEKPTKPPIQ